MLQKKSKIELYNMVFLRHPVQSAKILLLSPKYKIIMLPSNHNCYRYEPIYKTHTKIEAKRLRATTFDIAKLEER